MLETLRGYIRCCCDTKGGAIDTCGGRARGAEEDVQRLAYARCWCGVGRGARAVAGRSVAPPVLRRRSVDSRMHAGTALVSSRDHKGGAARAQGSACVCIGAGRAPPREERQRRRRLAVGRLRGLGAGAVHWSLR